MDKFLQKRRQRMIRSRQMNQSDSDSSSDSESDDEPVMQSHVQGYGSGRGGGKFRMGARQMKKSLSHHRSEDDGDAK